MTRVCFPPPFPSASFLLLILCCFSSIWCGSHLALCYLQTGPCIENSFLWFSLCLSPNHKLNLSHLSSAYNLLGFLNSKKGICNNSLKFQETLWTLISNISLKAGQAPLLSLKEPALLLPLFLIFTLLPLLCTVSCLLWSFSLQNFDLLKKIYIDR